MGIDMMIDQQIAEIDPLSSSLFIQNPMGSAVRHQLGHRISPFPATHTPPQLLHIEHPLGARWVLCHYPLSLLLVQLQQFQKSLRVPVVSLNLLPLHIDPILVDFVPKVRGEFAGSIEVLRVIQPIPNRVELALSLSLLPAQFGFLDGQSDAIDFVDCECAVIVDRVGDIGMAA